MVALSLESIDARARCGELRSRWLEARFERRFYTLLAMSFAALFLIFLAALMYQLVMNVDGTAGRITSLAGLVGTGAVGAYFASLAQKAKSEEDRRYTKYDSACPLPDNTAEGNLTGAIRQQLDADDQEAGITRPA